MAIKEIVLEQNVQETPQNVIPQNVQQPTVPTQTAPKFKEVDLGMADAENNIQSTSESLVSRFGHQLWNKAVADTVHQLAGDAEISGMKYHAAEALKQSLDEEKAKNPKFAISDELYESLLKDYELELQKPPQTREIEALKKYRQYAPTGEAPMAYDVEEAKTLGEKAIDVSTGIAAFVAQIAILRKAMPGVSEKVLWETQSLANGGTPGQGLAMYGVFGGAGKVGKEISGKIKGTGLAAKVGRKAAEIAPQSAAIAGVTAAEGGTAEDIAISAGVPVAMGLAGGLKGRPKVEKKPERDLSKVDLSKAPTGEAELIAEQLKQKQQQIIQRPIIQEAVESGKMKPEDVEMVKPYKGEEWADKFIKETEQAKVQKPEDVQSRISKAEQQIMKYGKPDSLIRIQKAATEHKLTDEQYADYLEKGINIFKQKRGIPIEEPTERVEGHVSGGEEKKRGAEVPPTQPPQAGYPTSVPPPKGQPKPTIVPELGKVAETAERVYQSTFNKFASIENLTKRAEKMGLKVKAGEDPQMRSREYLGIGKKVESVLEDKTFQITKEGKIKYTGEGLKPILKDFDTQISKTKHKPSLGENVKTAIFGKGTSPKDLQDFLIATRTVEDLQRPKHDYLNEPIATPKQTADAKKTLESLKAKYGSDMSIFDNTSKRLYDYQNRVLHSLVDAKVLSKKQFNDITSANKHYIPFERIMDLVEGIQGSPKSKGVFTRIRSGLRRITGSERPVEDVIQTVIKNTHRILDAAERNIVGQNIVKMAKFFPEIKKERIPVTPIKVDPKEIATEIRRLRFQTRPIIQEVESTTRTTPTGQPIDTKTPMDKLRKVVTDALMHRGMTQGEADNYVRKLESQNVKPTTGEQTTKVIKQIIRETTREIAEKVPIESTIFRPTKMPPPKGTIEIMNNGVRQWWKVPRNLYDSMSGMSETSSNLFVKLLSVPAHLLRRGATMTPEFMERNIVRDQMVASYQTSFGFKPFIDTAKAIADIMGKSNAYYDWLRSGGAYSGFAELSRPNLKKAYKEIMGKKGLLSHLNIISKAEDLSQLLEQATRLGSYKAAIRKGKTPVEAGFASREATVDFAVRGSKMKDISQLTAFLNAGLQGMDRGVRAFRKDPVGITMKNIAYSTIPTVLLYLRNRNDPDYEEIPRWRKDLFYITKLPGTDTYVYIPKPFAYGQIFSSLPERFMEYLDTKDPEAFDQFASSVTDSLLPVQGDPASGLLFTAVKPIIENATNYNFFRQQPIIPQDVEGLEPSQQYGKYTSETAKELGEFLNYSPSKIENLLQGYLGGSSKYLTSVSDKFIDSIKSDIEKKPSKPETKVDYPALRGFMMESPAQTGQAESIKKFYENRKKLSAAQKTIDKLYEQGNVKRATKIEKTTPNYVYAGEFESASKDISELNKAIEEIKKSKDLNPKEKRKQVGQLEKERITIAKQLNQLTKKRK